ncbi:MAG: hypothetical protein PHQ28_03380 [Mycobacterium sp.]|nr:hypothetical protein [Mycobacterium sp.]
MHDLTKWPRLLVVGDPVTPRQANEILLRTDAWLFATNDRMFESVVCQLIGATGDQGRPDLAAIDGFRRSISALDLHYMGNSRILTAMLGGPYGWCDWDGRVGCASYNIGKWPSVDAVTEDWQAIAAAFPYLDLSAQVVTHEGEGNVAAEWVVKEGRVETRVEGPFERLTQPQEFTEAEAMRTMRVGGERGVELDRLRQAIAQVRGEQLWLIHSVSDLWWKAEGYGYTTDDREAGRFLHHEAVQRCRGCEVRDGRPMHVPVPAPESWDEQVPQAQVRAALRRRVDEAMEQAKAARVG